MFNIIILLYNKTSKCRKQEVNNHHRVSERGHLPTTNRGQCYSRKQLLVYRHCEMRLKHGTHLEKGISALKPPLMTHLHVLCER